jgi:hypothetical protein
VGTLPSLLFAITGVLTGNCCFSCYAREAEPYEQEPINYSAATLQDGMSLLQKQIAGGELKSGEGDRGVVEALLCRLKIPFESQLLVFSRTSFQRERISPAHPRAIYFNDQYYVGWVPGGLVEITTIDPILGPIFYTFDPAVVQSNTANYIVRESDCLRCHGGTFVREIPGLFARSVFADQQGNPIIRFGSEVVDLRTPFTNRWGGWYVTGLHGQSSHRGNLFFSEQHEKPENSLKHGEDAKEISERFNVKPYLAEESSDIIALLIFEQQLTIQNRLTRASLDSRRMLDYQKKLQLAFKTPVTEEPEYDSVKSVLDHTAQDVVDDLLFKGEAELPTGIQGSQAFQKAFLAAAKETTGGKSLKDLDLQGHLFQNRCSYLVYSESFRSLPGALKRRIYARLEHALRAADPDPRYGYIGSEERDRILHILRETDPALWSALNQISSRPSKTDNAQASK